MSDGGKGDKPRPFSVPLEEFETNFGNIDWGRLERERKELDAEGEE